MMNRSIKRIESALKTWAVWCRDDQKFTRLMNVTYMPGRGEEYRNGRAAGLATAEACLVLLMSEQGIDLRPNKQEERT